MFGLPDISGYSMFLVICAIMAAGAFFFVIQATTELVTQAQTQRIVNRRLQFKDKFASTSEAMVELRKSRGLDADGNFAMPLERFNRLVVRSGLPYQPLRWAAMSAAGALVAAVAYIHFVGGLLPAVGIALAVFFVAPLFVLKHVAGKRRKKLAAQLPDALQIVCRSLEAGHPVTTASAYGRAVG